MKTVATDQRFSNTLTTSKTAGELVKSTNYHGPLFLMEEFQLLNVEGMREIEGHYEPNTAVIIVASKIHWWMLKLVGGSLGRNKGMENGTDLDWTGHEWCLLAHLSTLLSVIDSQESDSPSWGRHNPCVCSLSQFRNYLSGSTSLTQITLKKKFMYLFLAVLGLH